MAIEIRKIAGYGWKPSLPSIYDAKFKVPERGLVLPRHVDLHEQCPPIWAQASLGSCVGHGISRCWAQSRKKQGFPYVMPSRLFVYYGCRVLEGSVNEDAGASVRDGIQSIRKWGVPPEELWPYDTSKFKQKPTDASFVEAEKYQAIKYEKLNQDLYSLKACLALGFVFTFGFSVYENFESNTVAKTGLMPMPAGNNIGGHCVTAVGYNSHNYICCANSWSASWGDPDMPGHFWMPPEMITNRSLAADFWVVHSIES